MQGKALVSVMGDRSDIGTVNKVGGIELPYDVQVEGGAGFPQKFQDEGLGWASEFSIAKKKQAALTRAAEDSGRDVMGVYSAMGKDSINYSTPIAEIMMAQMSGLDKISRNDKFAFDADLRKVYPQWVGLEDPRAMDQLKGIKSDGMLPLPGKARTSFSTIMGKAEYRKKGFPTYNDAVEISTNPDLMNVGIGDSGYSMFDARPADSVGFFDGHQSYNAKIPGKYAGGFEDSLPSEVMFPDAFAGQMQRRTNPAEGNVSKPFTRPMAMNALGTRGDAYQVADQKWVDQASVFQEAVKRKGALGAADPRLLALLGGGAAIGTAETYRRQGGESPTEQARRILRNGGKLDQVSLFRQGVSRANSLAGQAFETLEMPIRGIHGLMQLPNALRSDITFEQAMSQADQVIRQPLDKTADMYGRQVTDSTGSPLLGTAAYLGGSMVDVIPF
jgi:hypothetical protein